MKLSKQLMAGGLASCLMVSGAFAVDPVAVEIKPIVITIHIDPTVNDVVKVGEVVIDDTVGEVIIDDTDGEDFIDVTFGVINDVDGEVPIEWLIRSTGAGPVAEFGAAAPTPVALSTDAGKDEAAALKAAGISAPTKSIASAGKRTSAVIKAGRVFLGQ